MPETDSAAAGTPCWRHGQPTYHTTPGDCGFAGLPYDQQPRTLGVAADGPRDPLLAQQMTREETIAWSLYEAMHDRVERALTLIDSFDPTSGATRARVFAADLRRILEGTGG